MFFYTRYPSSNMLKMYFSDVKVSPKHAHDLQTFFDLTNLSIFARHPSIISLFAVLNSHLKGRHLLRLSVFCRSFFSTSNAPALKGEVWFVNCDMPASVATNNVHLSSLKTMSFPLLRHWLYAKDERRGSGKGLREGAGEPISILKIKTGMSNGRVESAERRMEPRDRGVVIWAGVRRTVWWRERRSKQVQSGKTEGISASATWEFNEKFGKRKTILHEKKRPVTQWPL